MKNPSIQALQEKLDSLQKRFNITTDPDERAELGEEMDYVNDEIDEVTAWDMDQERLDEETGNTAQDRYIERNSYALVQSDRYEQFRKEY